MYSGEYDEYECTCNLCGGEGQGTQCDVELSNPCSGCICDGCAAGFDQDWLEDLREQARRAARLLKDPATPHTFKLRQHLVSATEHSLCGNTAFLPRLEGKGFAFEDSPDYEFAEKCREEAIMRNTLPPNAYVMDIEVGADGKFKSLWCAGKDLLAPPRAPGNNRDWTAVTMKERRKALLDLRSIHAGAPEAWNALLERFVANPGSLNRFDYLQLLAGQVVTPVPAAECPPVKKRKRAPAEPADNPVGTASPPADCLSVKKHKPAVM